jgi:hypothetical protein
VAGRWLSYCCRYCIFSHHEEVKIFVCIDRYVYDLVNPVICGVRNRILWDTGSDTFKTYKIGTVHRKFGPTRYLLLRSACVNNRLLLARPLSTQRISTRRLLQPAVCALHLGAPWRYPMASCHIWWSSSLTGRYALHCCVKSWVWISIRSPIVRLFNVCQ